MTPEQFVYWLQGFAEHREAPPSPAEWASVRDHLGTVFRKETPNRLGVPLEPVATDFRRAVEAEDRGLRRRVSTGRLIC